MDLEQARAFIRANHRAVLATRRRDDGVQMSPVLAGVDGEGRAIISTRETAFKTQYDELKKQHPKAVLAILQSGEVLGEIALLDGKERTADARALTTCNLAVLERRDVLAFLDRHPRGC